RPLPKPERAMRLRLPAQTDQSNSDVILSGTRGFVVATLADSSHQADSIALVVVLVLEMEMHWTEEEDGRTRTRTRIRVSCGNFQCIARTALKSLPSATRPIRTTLSCSTLWRNTRSICTATGSNIGWKTFRH